MDRRLLLERQLYTACEDGDLETVCSLIQSGVNVNSNDPDDLMRSPLNKAACYGRVSIVKVLLKKGANVHETSDDLKETALHRAAKAGHVSIVKELLIYHADVNVEDENMLTPLHNAARYGHDEVVIELIKNGADMHAQDENGKTALHIAAAKGSTSIVLTMLKNGVNANCTDQFDNTPFHMAIIGGHIDTLQELIRGGADISCVTKDKKTPLHYAAERNHIDAIKILLENKIDVDARDKNKKAPIHHVCERRLSGVLETLIQYGASLNVKDKDGKTPLHYASEGGSIDIVMQLLKHGAFTNVQDKSGCSPLHLAARRAHTNVVHLLISYEADVNIEDNENYTALHHAVRRIHPETVLELVAHGAVMEQKEALLVFAQRLVDTSEGNRKKQLQEDLKKVHGHLAITLQEAKQAIEKNLENTKVAIQSPTNEITQTDSQTIQIDEMPTYSEEFIVYNDQLNNFRISLYLDYLRHNSERPDTFQVVTTVLLVFLICLSLYRSNEIPPTLPGVHILNHTSFVVSGGVSKNFNWEGYGIRIHVPHNALPGGFISRITIHVSVSGPYSFPKPEEWKTSSAVYWISCTKSFVHPIQIGIQHSIKNMQNSSKIRFVTASDDDHNGKFVFKELPGGYFDANDSYGYIFLTHFSGLSISSDNDTDERFVGRLFYRRATKTANIWKCSFLIYRQMASGILKNILRIYRGWRSDPETTVEFKDAEVELLLSSASDWSGWKIQAIYPPPKYVKKQLLQSLDITSDMQFIVWHETSVMEPLMKQLPLIGADRPNSIPLIIIPGHQDSEVIDDNIEEEEHLMKWISNMSSSLEYCKCLQIQTAICNQIIRDNRGNTKEQLIQISHVWYITGQRRWSEYVSAFHCLNMQKVAKQISEEYNVVNPDEEEYDSHIKL